MLRTLVSALFVCAAFSNQLQAKGPLVPMLDGPMWQVAGVPDLGEFNSDKQQPVDFGVWQAADGTWQLWSCIRHTKCGGKTRLFHCWEGKNLTDKNWKPMGVVMTADPSLGEQAGGLQAPHVFKHDGKYVMAYGDWNRICLATSTDGKKFERIKNKDGQPNVFTSNYWNTRDPMTLKIGDIYYCYFMGHRRGAKYDSVIMCCTSPDLVEWSDPILVSGGGSANDRCNSYGADAECPFVFKKDGMFYLFRNQLYGEDSINTQYASKNPLNFGLGHDRFELGTLPIAAPEIIHHEGQWYVASLNLGLDGIRIGKLKWEEKEEEKK